MADQPSSPLVTQLLSKTSEPDDRLMNWLGQLSALPLKYMKGKKI